MTTENRQDVDLAASNLKEAMGMDKALPFEELVRLRSEQIANRGKPQEAPPEQTEEQEEPQSDNEEPEAAQDDESESADTGSENDVLSKFNLEELSEDELAELGNAIRSKVPKRFGELTKRAKTAEEQLEVLQRQIEELKNGTKNPLEREKPTENNPFSKYSTVNELQEQWDNAERVEEWAMELLDEHEEYGADEVITETDGKKLTKKQVKQYLRNAQNARKKFLPARLRELQQFEQAKQVQEALIKKAEGELEWLGDADSDARREYDAVLQDATVAKIKSQVPEISSQLDYILAHAVNSLMLAKQKPSAPQKAPRINPPSNPDGVAPKAVGRDKGKIQLKALEERVMETREYDDFIALRTQQRLQKR